MDEGSPTESDSDIISSDTSCDPRDSPSNSAKDLQDNASNSNSDLPDIWGSDNESHNDDDVDRDLPSTSTGRVTGSGCGKRHIAIKQDTSLPSVGKDSAVDYESDLQAEEQLSGIGEKNSELDGDYKSEGQPRNQRHHNEPRHMSGDVSHASDGKGNGMTLGDLWKESQSYSQVDASAVEYKFEGRPWDLHLADFSNPDIFFQSQESPLPQDSPSAVHISSGIVRSSDCEGNDAPSASGTYLRHPGCGLDGSCKDEINLAMTKSRRKPHCSDDNSSTNEGDLTSWDNVQKKPDFDKQSDARRKLKVKRKKKCRDRRGQKKKQKVAKSGKCYSLGDVGSLQDPESNQVSTNEVCLQQGRGPEQSEKMDRLPPKIPARPLNEGSGEEPIDTVSDEDTHKIRRCLVSTKASAVSENETDSDETMIDSNDGDDHGHTENMTGDEVGEVVLKETTENFDTQPSSPILHEESDDSLSDASEEFPTSDTIVPRDFPPHLLEDKEHNDREAADLEPNYHVSCQSPDEEIHQPQRDDAGLETSSNNGVNPPRLQIEDDSHRQYFPTDSQLSIKMENEDTEDLTTQQLQQKPLEDDSQGQYFPKDSQLSIKMENEDTKEQVNQHEKGTVSHGKEAQAAMSIPSKGVSKDVDKDSGKKLLSCQRNAWCPLELDPQERFLLLQEEQLAMSIPSKAHLSGGISEDLDKNSGKKFLPCLRNAWSPSRLHPQERLLLLQEGESEPVYSFSLESLAVPFSRCVAPSISTAAPDKLVASRNEQHIQRPSRPDKLPSTTKQNDRQKEKNDTKRTDSLQDIPDTSSNTLSLSSKEPSESPSTSMIRSVQDCLQQPASLNSNEMGLEDRLPADSRSLSHGHSSIPSVSFPSTSLYSSNISESSRTLNGGHSASSGTSETPSTKPDRLKPTGDDRSACPSDPPDPSLVASDMSKPLKKRRHSQTSSVPSGNQGTEPSKVNQVSPSLHLQLLEPFSRCVAPSISTAAPDKLVASRNEQHIQRPSRPDKLPSTTKQNDRQKEKNPTLRTNYVQDVPCTPSNPPSLSSKEPSETSFVSVIHSEQDCLQQPASSNSNEMDLEDILLADSRSLSHGHSSILGESFPSTSSYSANISETIGGQAACSGTSSTPNTKQDRAKPTEEDRSTCPGDPPNPSLVPSDIRKPPEKRRHSQTSSHPADAVMPAGAILLPPVVDTGSRSSQELNSKGNAPMIVGEQHVPNALRDISQSQSFQATQASCDGVEKIRSSGNDGVDNGCKKRVRLDTGTEDHGKAAKVTRSCDSIHGESSSGKSFGGSSHFPPSSRDPAQPRSILKKPDRNVASTSHEEDIGVVGHQVHRNLRSHSRSITAQGITASSSSTCSPQRQRRKSSRLDASLDTEDGKSLQVSVTGTGNDVRFSRQQKGKNKAGQQRKHPSSRTDSIKHGRRERRQFGEATRSGTSQTRKGSKGNETGQNQSLDRQKRQSRSDQRPQRQSRQQKVSSEKQEHVRSEKRSSGEVTGARTSQRRKGSNGHVTGQNQSLDHQKQQSRSDQRPQRKSRQQKVSPEKQEHVRSEKRSSGEVTGARTSQRRKGSNGNVTGQNQSLDHQKRQSRSDQRPQRKSRQQKLSPERQEHDNSERRPTSEVTGAGTSQRCTGSNGNETGQNQSLDHQQRQNRSDQRPQRKSRQQKVSPERQKHDNSERRLTSEVTGAGTSQRRNGSKGNETGQNQSLDHQQRQSRSDQRPQRKSRQQKVSPERQVHDNSERRPTSEVTGAGTSQRCTGSNGNETGQNQSLDHQQRQSRSDQRPQRKSRQQKVSPERQKHDNSERRLTSEVTIRTSQRRNGSKGNETGQNQSLDHQQRQSRSDQRPQRKSCQQKVSPERQEHDNNERRPTSEVTGAGTSQRCTGSNGNETGQNQSPDHHQQQGGSDQRLRRRSLHKQDQQQSGSDQLPSRESSLLKSCSIT
ncbi:uncharacterized protein LOC105447191 [Strongylocentrotus purpuratus]|uniref:Uncharacterized protein n=1 Tax=Strongylocentrotus purpuratus TaxID=7668 RepID=A0A7M7NZW1_STRPU|nr:uncharacterized protein LOC105447191 [Strongylocentrotus purpuratus]